jgi:hypothetical protein
VRCAHPRGCFSGNNVNEAVGRPCAPFNVRRLEGELDRFELNPSVLLCLSRLCFDRCLQTENHHDYAKRRRLYRCQISGLGSGLALAGNLESLDASDSRSGRRGAVVLFEASRAASRSEIATTITR